MDPLILDPDAAEPLFEQLRTQIASRVATAELQPGERLPTVRALATELGLAVNTVAKVYRELEADGVVVTEGRRGTSVRSAGAGVDVRAAAASFATAARGAGLTRTEAARLLDDAW